MSAPLDVVYIAASALDARLTRICVASVRYFYPDLPIKLLAGGMIERGLVKELARYWNVGLADLPRGEYGWGFIKLEPLFGPAGERFLVLDSDTVITGPVLDIRASASEPFIVDDEQQSQAEIRRLYYDWEGVREVDPRAGPPAFVFNSGQWFGTAGLVTRDDFARLVEWGMPPRLKHPDLFMPGDQGILNYVLNQKAALDGLPVARRKIMRWPPHGMDDLTPAAVAARTAPALVVHWAGVKAMLLHQTAGAELLQFFEDLYYAPIPGGRAKRRAAVWRQVWTYKFFRARQRFQLRSRRLRAALTLNAVRP